MLEKKSFLFSFVIFSMLAVPALAQSWANLGTVSTLNNNELCYTDGKDIICDGGLTVNGTAALDVSGTVSATAFIGDGSGLTGLGAEFVVSGTAVVNTTDVNTNDFVFGAPQLADTGNTDFDNRMFFDKSKGAFRSGIVTGLAWDEVNVGFGSTAMGRDTSASGIYSTAMGQDTIASGIYSTALGLDTTASGPRSTAMGEDTIASGEHSTAMGDRTMASGFWSTAMGESSAASGSRSTAMGGYTIASGDYSTAMGRNAYSYGDYSTSMGREVVASGDYSLAIGLGDAVGSPANYPQVTGTSSMGIFMGANTDENLSDSNTFAIMGGEVGIGLVNPNAALEVAGTVSATAFIGDGASLTNVGGLWTDAGDYIVRDGLRVYVSGTTIDIDSGDRVAFWDEEKAALRIGVTSSASAWDDANIGVGSVAFNGGQASGVQSYALNGGTASGDYSFAMGGLFGANSATASGNNAIALGRSNNVSGSDGVALGISNDVGQSAAALGRQNTAGASGVAVGKGNTTGSGSGGSYAFGHDNTAINHRALSVGFLNNTTGYASTPSQNTHGYALAFGTANNVTGDNALAFGTGMNVTADNSMAIGVGLDASGSTVADADTLAIMGATGGVGIGLVNPNAALEVAGTVSATAFVGDGASLTNVGGLWTDAGDYIVRDGLRVYNASTTINLSNGDRVAFWDPEKGAFRVGQTVFNEWDDANIGVNSVAFAGAKALGSGSFAWGGSTSRGVAATTGTYDLALGAGAQTTGGNSWKMAIGVNALASDSPSNMAIGPYAEATGGGVYESSFAVGPYAKAAGGSYNMAVGHFSEANTGIRNIALGHHVEVTGSRSTALGYGIQVTGDDSIGLGVGADASGTVVSDNDTFAIIGATGGVGIGLVSPLAELDVSGSIQYTGTLRDISDERLKQNIQPLSSELDKIIQVNPVSFEMKNNPSVKELGVIAQELEEVYPSLVNTANNEMGTKSVNYIGLIAPMLKAMQEQQAQIEELKKQIEILKQQ